MDKLKIRDNQKIISIILLLIVFLGAFAVCCMINYSDGDDAFFKEQITNHPQLFDFVSYLTKTMNGRITSTFALWFVFKLPLLFWRLVNALFITAFVFINSKIIYLFKKGEEKIYNYYIFSLSTFSIVGIGVIGYSCLWITGSVNYLWPLCFAMISIYPILRLITLNKSVSNIWWVVSIISGFYVALAQEQIAVVYMCFLFAIFLSDLLKNKKLNIPLFITLAVIIIAVIVLMISPFTQDRTGRELRWLPEYATMSFFQKFFITVQWLIHSFTHSLRFVLIFLWINLAISFIKKKKIVLAIIPAVFSLIAIIPTFFAKFLIDVGLNELDMTKKVERAPRLSDLSTLQGALIVFWVFVLIVTLVLGAEKE